MAWAKVHTDILSDPKLMRAARRGAEGLELLPWLIVAAKSADDHGRLSVTGGALEAEDLAPMIPGVSVAHVAAALISLTTLAVLLRDDDGVLRFASWSERQAAPSASKDAVRERVRQHRQRRRSAATKAQQAASNGDTDEGNSEAVTGVTEEVTSDVTAAVTRQTKTKTETKTERETETESTDPVTETNSQKGKEAAPDGAPPAEKGGWPARLAALWSQGVGLITPGEIGKHLKPVVDAHGEDQVTAALKTYIAEAPKTEKPGFLKPQLFARQVAHWIRESQPVPVYTDSGEMHPEFARRMGIKP